MRGKPLFREVQRSTVERIARIIGEHSACAAALRDAAEREARGESVLFVEEQRTGVLYVINRSLLLDDARARALGIIPACRAGEVAVKVEG